MEYGRRLLPQVVDHHAVTDPTRVYATISRSARSLSHGFRDVTMAELAAMVNHFARWINANFAGGSSDGHFETIAYIGPADIRYAVLLLASIKTKHKMLFISPRNRPYQNISMLQQAECKTLFYAVEMAAAVEPIQDGAQGVCFVSAPSLLEFLDTPVDSEHYPYDKTFDEAQNDPCLILHSSGSTGDPKLVTLTHGTFSVTDNDRNMPVPEGRVAQNASLFNFQGGGKFYSCFPPYHLGGVHAYIDLPIFATSATVVFGPSSLPASGYLLSEILKSEPVCAFYVPPSIVEQWIAEPEASEQLKALEFIFYGGGPLSPQIGDMLCKATRVCQLYGSLEIGQLQVLLPQAEEWPYLELNPYEECDMQPDGTGCFELVLHQNPKLAAHRSLWHNFPHLKTWRTGDLFVAHPSKKGLWRFHSRVDDMVVLSTTHKIRPTHMETIIQGHPLVAAALVVGQGRPEPLLLLETHPGSLDGSDAEADPFIDRVWPTVEEANKIAPTYARIGSSNIVVARRGRHFVRAPKGTIVRKLTVEAFADEIEAAYAQNPSHSNANSIPAGGGISDFLRPSVTQFVRKHVEQHLPGFDVSDTDNIFVKGLDSLRAAELSRSLQRGLSSQTRASASGTTPQVQVRTIYQHPSIDALSAVVFDLLLGGDSSSGSSGGDGKKDMAMLVDEFTRDLPATHTKPRVESRSDGIKVAIVGPRGSLGSNIVRELLANSGVDRIYCLNRGQDGKEQMLDIFQKRGWEYSAADSERLIFMPVELSKPRLNLSPENYTELLNNVHVIIHNAWKVNFSWTTDMFKSDYLSSVRELVDFASQGSLSPRIVFISSVASVQEWANVYATPVSESRLPSYDVASPLGYGQSKHVSERILEKASEVSGIPVTILRVGQVAGPTTPSGSAWSTDEWVPSLAAISRTLSLVPNDIAPIDWVPVDLAAKAICEIALAEHRESGLSADDEKLHVFNVVNPAVSDWSRFANTLQRRLGSGVEQVPLNTWVNALVRTDPKTMPEAEASSSTKILPFFQHLAEMTNGSIALQPSFETGKAVKVSGTMEHMQAIDEHLISLWLTQWGI